MNKPTTTKYDGDVNNTLLRQALNTFLDTVNQEKLEELAACVYDKLASKVPDLRYMPVSSNTLFAVTKGDISMVNWKSIYFDELPEGWNKYIPSYVMWDIVVLMFLIDNLHYSLWALEMETDCISQAFNFERYEHLCTTYHYRINQKVENLNGWFFCQEELQDIFGGKLPKFVIKP